ncbi:hypothetical protein FHS04_000503 [Mesoflavibacter sabulilitoris]|uniref:Uncharacterized protein n=1 Tax=Mesoflavibacter zeaxanthinifaciens subsp. sabulilitoris TaxID=1520893 RepID=A0A2T1NGF1_9FLAO|nr:hypothetical protein [Mesoflavibacter zeaxanthinifaciens]MBB3123015.1 hypothetical protein [Mesoflavibacter zeaxanthinifaciens subsp. sabulilitoris]PSG91915.1 hypothetical protein C7H61_04900 [Mesoflavibacter zeaxanthinifaciens subsp. sabulilitoris]
MKNATEIMKKKYLILIIKFSIISIFVITVTRAIILTSMFWEVNIESGFKLESILKIIERTSYYVPSLILIIPLVGVFFNKKIGWVLIQSYFYFLITNLTFRIKYYDFNDKTKILLNFVGFLLIMLIIILMNKNKISDQVYGIRKLELIKKNIIASVIGIMITITLALSKI